jgi:membrane-associated phospholipid phosphatase
MSHSFALRAVILGFVITTIARSADAQLIPEGATPSTDAISWPAVDFADPAAQPSGAPATPRHTGIKAMLKGVVADVKHLPSRENLLWAGVGGGLALALHPLDARVNRQVSGNELADNIFRPGRILGGPLPIVASVGVYAFGRIKDRPKVSHVGMDLIRAQVLAQIITQTLKYSTRRERPDHSSRNSFPSGHASTTFAVATAIERHLGWRYSVPAYTFASYVAASRLPSNRHWLSDVVFGAAVGVIAGRTATSREANPYPVTVTYVPGGAAIVYSPKAKRLNGSS